MSTLAPSQILQSSSDAIGSALDALPLDSLDFSVIDDAAETLGDTVSVVASTGGRTVFGAVRYARRHPRGTGVVLLVLIAMLAFAAYQRRSTADQQVTAA